MVKEVKVGDLVQLKSGGPRMTVDQIDSDGCVKCKWFFEGQLREGAFRVTSLVVAE